MIAGRYTLDREIGRGGMGAVYLARDEVLGRQVAIKRIGLMPGVETPDLDRVGREAQLAARINHPHVVAVFDLVDDGDEHWLVMEHVEGRNLTELVRAEGPLPPERAAPLMRQVADALTAAHAAGIVHRDVKPGNILVTPHGQAKLTDFGIARGEADAALTQTGMMSGSPAYLSPEVATGSRATAASDVWSFGATLYFALAGRAPYEAGDNVMGTLFRIAHEDPPRLPEAGPLAPLLEATMTKEPDARRSMREVRDALGPAGAAALGGGYAAASRADAEQTAVMPATAAAPSSSDDPDPDATRTTAVAEEPATTARSTAGQRPLPPPADPVPATTARRERTEERPRRSGGVRTPLLVAGLLAVVLVIALALILGRIWGGDVERGASGGSDGSDGSGGSPSASASPSADPEEQKAQAMRGFVRDYLDTVTSDPAATWPRLTEDFQAESGGFGSYSGFWSRQEITNVSEIQADPDALTVSYRISYGNGSTDDVTLQLVEDGDGFKIAGES